ncbi:uncharacterized protein LOC129911945 [Episyrphus balteatus]|uniref:uncharacterized protein LOC129911945 n=1 Tax=Episyrphus balteatus TaxID=286459 RepID=UPI0024855DEB|nr:uncharacterized protein LOC129911945 [Episyrphus balteatus]
MNQSQSSDKRTDGLPAPVWENNTTQVRIETNYGQAEPPRLSWFKDSQKNKPQSNSLSAASVIFVSGGMSWASSIGFGGFTVGSHIQVCWFFGVIIGACISAILVHKIKRRLFDIVASVLVVLNGIIFIVSDSYTALVFARYFDGIAFGLTLISIIIAGSEQSVKRFRGMHLTVEQTGLVSGAIINIFVLNNSWNPYPNFFYGILATCFGLVTLISTFFLTIESPVFHLRQNNDNEALNVLRRLQKPKIVTDETYSLLNESKALLREDENRGESANISNSLIPMIKLILFRCFVTMSSFLPMTALFYSAIIMATFPNLGNYTVSYYSYLYILMRMIGVVISIFSLDTIGRKLPSTIAVLGGGILLIVIGILDLNTFNKNNANITLYLIMFYQLFSGAMASASTCYLSEAFSVSVKPYFICAVILCENLLQIIVCCTISNLNVTTFSYTLGIMQIIYAIVFYITMPETRQTTLRNALKMFEPIFPGRS